MATSKFHTQKPLFVVLSVVVVLLTMTKVNSTKPFLSPGTTRSLGRALYSTPIHIWDSEIGSVASFAASFNFTVYASDIANLADGLAFFLAPIDTQPQTRGGYLGLYNNPSNSSWGLANDQVTNVLITYDASTNLLVASLVHPSQRSSYILSDVLDLKVALPEWVRIGFSATTGLNVASETHDVHSWSFSSNLPFGSSNTNPSDFAIFI
ncbi:Lectin [Glycine max]|nr:Lectin [Glycine max]